MSNAGNLLEMTRINRNNMPKWAKESIEILDAELRRLAAIIIAGNYSL